MKIYFYPVPYDETKNGLAVGRVNAWKNESKWVEAPADFNEYLTAGYVKGVDHIVINDKAYMMMKTYMDLSNDRLVIICTESVTGCDK